MRGTGLFIGGDEGRLNPVKLIDPRPIPRLEDRVTTGDAGRDGYSVLSRASPGRQGRPPPVKGQDPHGNHQGPAMDFEQ